MPCAAWLATGRFHPTSKACAKLIAPASDRLVGHDHAAFKEQFFDVTQAQLIAVVPAHGATDDAGWKTVTAIQRCRFLHRVILRGTTSNLTTPCRPPTPELIGGIVVV
jgi:hypothetical protein